MGEFFLENLAKIITLSRSIYVYASTIKVGLFWCKNVNNLNWGLIINKGARPSRFETRSKTSEQVFS